MEKLNDSVNLQEEFEKFKEEYKDDLKRFIGYKDDVEFVLDEKALTFYFSPKEKKIGIPLTWFIEYLAVLKGNGNGLEQYKLHGKFGLAHEFSHFRDMLKEQDVTKESSMYKVLKRLSGRKIKISEDKYIPIGEMVHTIYNSIDDIVVNYEVMNFMSFGITPDMIKTLYQTKLFADYEEQPDGSKELNVDKPVDYSTIPDYTAISYYFLRKKMVPDQKIILSDNLKGILFNAEGKNIPWSTSLARLKKLFDDEVNQAKNSDDADTQRRYEQLKSAIVSQRSRLEHMDRGKIRKLLEAALKKCLGCYNPAKKISAPTVSLETIIDLFTVNKGGDDSHILCILPDLRYQIYEAIFEPIIETLILIYALHDDIKDGGGGGGGGGEGGEEGGEGGEEGGDDIQSGSGSYNRSLEDALKYIKEAAEYNQNKKKEAQRKKESQKIGKSIIEVLTSKGMSSEDLERKEKVQRNFSQYLEQITKILYEELDAVEIESDTIDAISKKGTLSYDEFLKEYSKSFVDGDFSDKSIYKRKRRIETIKEEFKKLCFYFMIDVSASTSGFKGENGLLNGVTVALAGAIKNVETVIQNLSGDPSYTIPIKFIIYTDKVNHFTDDDGLADIETEIVRVNSLITTISGGTNDTHGWIMAGDELAKDLRSHPEYIEDIKGGKMKPVVIQIADQDVSDDGVEELRKTIQKEFGEEINAALEPKRIILGWKQEEETVEMPEDEGHKKSNWEKEYVRGPDGQILLDEYGRKKIKVKQIGLRTKNEIVDRIRQLFKNFFADMVKEKL